MNLNSLKLTFILLIIVVSHLLNAQKHLNQNSNILSNSNLAGDQVNQLFQPIGEQTYYWDEILQAWEISDKYTYEYDSSNRLIKRTAFTSANTPMIEESYTYDIDDQIISIVYKNYDEELNDLVFSFRNTYEFNEFGEQIVANFETYENENWQAFLQTLTTRTYNAEDLPTEVVTQNYFQGELIEERMETFTYDLEQRLLVYEQYSDSGNGLLPFTKVELEYNQGAQPISFTSYEVDENEVYVPIFRKIQLSFASYQSYFENDISAYVMQEFNGNDWININKYEKTSSGANSIGVYSVFFNGFWIPDTKETLNFDELGLPILDQLEFRNEDNWLIEYAQEYINDYAANFEEIYSIVLKEWDDKFQSNQNFFRRDFTYLSTSISKINDSLRFVIYPNPAKGFINYEMDAENTILSIFDGTGKRIQTEVLSQKIGQIPLTKLKSGFYFLNFTDQKGNSRTEKLIVH